MTRLDRLNRLLEECWTRNPFYRAKWITAGLPSNTLKSLSDLDRYPFLSRQELFQDQECSPPLGTNLTAAWQSFRRIVHSSGSSTHPIVWCDTVASWQWAGLCSRQLYDIAEVTPNDRIFLLMPLGSRSGPNLLLEGARLLGALCILPNTMELEEHRRRILSFQLNVLVGKPARLLQLADYFKASGTPPAACAIKKLILTGEPVDETLRQKLEILWEAMALQRYGLTEAGSVASECPARQGLHLLDQEFIAELPKGLACPSDRSEDACELVLTSLGRSHRPIIRYRTGDQMRLATSTCPCGRLGPRLASPINRIHR